MHRDTLQRTLDRYPRIPLANYPTPLEYLPSLSSKVGREIFIKRDDQIGPGLGGNKTRKLEYLLGQAVQRGDRKVVTFGGLQSNHARITAAAANRLGLEPHLFSCEELLQIDPAVKDQLASKLPLQFGRIHPGRHRLQRAENFHAGFD